MHIAKKTISIVVFTVCILLFPSVTEYVVSDQTIHPSDDILEGSFRKEIDGVTIVSVSGSHYQMGYQYGYHLREEIHRNCRAFFHRCPKNLTFLSDTLFEWWQITNLSLLPQIYQDEITGLLDGANLNYSHESNWNRTHESIPMFCSGVSAWGSATQDTRLLHMRSLDSPLFKDPESDTYVHDNQVILIRNPAHGYRSLSPSVAGDLGLYGGMNDQGISLSWVSGFSNDIDTIGIPLGFRLKQVLDYTTSIDEALQHLQSNRTNALSYIISDASIPRGYVNEQTAHLSYVGTWNSSSESNHPFWHLEHLVRRTNIFINKTVSKTQRPFFNPSILPYIMSLFRFNQFYDNTYYFLSNVPSSGSWIHYDVLSRELERMHGAMNKTNALPLLQRVYRGETDIRYAIVTNLFNTGLDPWHQWVAIPETGDIYISFAHKENTADKNVIQQFNIHDF